MKICIAGIGKLGYSIAESILSGNNDITIIDIDNERIQTVGRNLDAFTIQGDALKADTLKDIHIEDQDLLIATTESDEKNMLICSFAKRLGCKHTIARVSSPEHVAQLDFIKDTMGIDRLISPDYECAREIYKYLTQKYSLTGGLFTQDGISILEFDIEKVPQLIGKKVMESTPYLDGLLIGAISDNGKIIIPNGYSELKEGMELYVVGLEKDIYKFSMKVRSKEKSEMPKHVMIAGGGRTGLFLSQMLERKKINVKIIEKDTDRCKYLASVLNDTTVLSGDASDINVLREEGLDFMDAFVAATGFDEENLLLSLLVKQYKVKDVVAKVSRQTFIPLIKELGTSAIINPQEIIANDIMATVRRQGIVLFSTKINGQAEFREIQTESSMPLTKKTLLELDIPEGVIVIAVHRGDNIIIPNGKTQIAPGDRVVLLSLLSANAELETLLTNSQTSVL